MALVNQAHVEGHDHRQSMRRARYCCYAGFATSGSLTVFCPVITPIIGAISLVGWGYGLYRIQREIVRMEVEEARLGQAQSFSLNSDTDTPNEVPLRPAMPDDSKLKQWEPEWVPCQMTYSKDVYEGEPVQRWRKRVWLGLPGWKEVLDQQRAWLSEHHPGRMKLVNEWWVHSFLTPLLRRRFGSDQPTQEQIAKASRSMEAELRIGIAIAGQPALWTRKLGVGREVRTYRALGQILQHHAGKEEERSVPPFPRFRRPVRDHLFIGKGFQWDQRHAQAREDLMVHNQSEFTDKNNKEQGDASIFGVGAKDAMPQFLEEKKFNEHTGIFGSTGVGKTRYVEPILVQAIQDGHAVIIIDPKGDVGLIDRTAEECRRAGRGHQFRYMTLVTPTNSKSYEFLSTYSPTYSYDHWSELPARIGAVVPDTKDAFWKNAAIALINNCTGICDSLMRYLTFIGRNPKGARSPRDSVQVPRVILAMTYAKDHPECTPEQAALVVDRVVEAMRDPAWLPCEDEKAVVEVMTTRSLGKNPIYAPIEWNPTVRQIAEYEVDATVQFLGWALKIFFYHSYLGQTATAAPDFPRTCTEPQIVSKAPVGGAPSLWSIYQAAKHHPLEVRFTANASVTDDARRWQEFYDYFIPDVADEHYELETLFSDFRKVIEGHYSDCVKDRQKFLEQATTLSSSIKPFLGEKGKIVCSLDPDITWKRVADEGLVTYFALGSMLDRVASETIAKMMVEDISSFVGRIYARNPGRHRAIYLVCDEIGTFINKPMIDMLNKARGAGLRIIILGQTNADLANALGSLDAARMVKGNLNTLIQLRTQLPEDARDFSERVRKVAVVQTSVGHSLTPSVGQTGSRLIDSFQTNESGNTQRQKTEAVNVSDLLNLPRGQAFVHTQGRVLLLAQGLFPDPKTKFLEECGMNEGTMLETWEPEEGNDAYVRRVISGSSPDPTVPTRTAGQAGRTTRPRTATQPGVSLDMAPIANGTLGTDSLGSASRDGAPRSASATARTEEI